MRDLNESAKALRELLSQRILVLDGAMGTMLQQRNLTAADFGGPALEGCNENLVRTRPDVVLDIHRKYLEAGADVIETDSFNGTKSDLIDYGVADQSYELMFKAAQLARQAADEYATPAKPRFVAGSMGPTRKTITVTGGISFEHLKQDYYDLAKPLIDGGADLLTI
jgi:5-methyltetrahydrofolate--homocysteine methyltransferase